MTSTLVRECAEWNDYELLGSGDGEKCERFGDVVMVRPEPQALWRAGDKAAWSRAHLMYSRKGQEGEWVIKKSVPEAWTVAWENLIFRVRPTSFKHTGLFPEQASNWAYLRANLKPGMKVLNLFGYTGGATVAAASAGCEVTHVDASKTVVTWGKENLELSGLGAKKVRWIVDDAAAFVLREARRGNVYDAICMDPPAFGRGPKGEVWQFENDLPVLLERCAAIMNRERGTLLVNAYSLGFPALSVENLVRSTFSFLRDVSSVELTLCESTPRAFLLPTGVVVRATW